MSKSNNNEQVNDSNVEYVTSPKYLPYSYLPFDSYLAARSKHPHAKLIIYQGLAPAGFQIVALPIQMVKPEEEVADEEAVE